MKTKIKFTYKSERCTGLPDAIDSHVEKGIGFGNWLYKKAQDGDSSIVLHAYKTDTYLTTDNPERMAELVCEFWNDTLRPGELERHFESVVEV